MLLVVQSLSMRLENIMVCECGSKRAIRKFDGYICGECFIVLHKHPNSPVIDCEWEILSSATKELGRGIELITQALERLND